MFHIDFLVLPVQPALIVVNEWMNRKLGPFHRPFVGIVYLHGIHGQFANGEYELKCVGRYENCGSVRGGSQFGVEQVAVIPTQRSAVHIYY